MSDPLAFPRLHPGVRMTPFSSAARERTFLVTCPDGRALEVSGKLSQLLACLDGEHSCAQIAQHLSHAWQTPVREAEVRIWLAQYLLPRDILLAETAPPAGPAKPPSAKQGLRGVTLFPARTLRPLSGPLRFLFHPRVALPLLWASALCHLCLYAPLLSGTMPRLAPTPGAWALGTLLLLLSVLFHELGHLAACRWFGCPHGEVRFGLYLIFPVLYANVTAAWQLPRKARVVVDLGGVYFQLILTLPLFLLNGLGPGTLWLFLLLQLDAMILFALNPFLRFDGYWVCSDLLGVPNLHARSRRVSWSLLRRLAGRGRAGPHPFLELRRPEAVGLVLYTAGSYAFYLGILLLLARFLPQRLAALPERFRQVAGLLPGQEAAGPSGGLNALLSVVFTLVLLAAVSRAGWRLFTGLRQALARRAQRKQPVPHGPQDPGLTKPGESSPQSA